MDKINAIKDYAEDTVITSRIKTAILAAKGVDSLNIHVDTEQGIVTLSGKVENATQIEFAEKIAREVTGVKEIINTLFFK